LVSDGLDKGAASFADEFNATVEKRRIQRYAVLIGAAGSDAGVLKTLGFDVTTIRDISDAQRKEEQLGEKLFTI
jgi:hypothetical protein